MSKLFSAAKRHERLLLAFAAAAVMVLGLALPGLTAAVQDAAARQAVTEVPCLLSAQAARLPLVWRFWVRANSSGAAFAEIFYSGADAESAPFEETLLPVLSELHDAGALADELYLAALAEPECLQANGVEAALRCGPLGFARYEAGNFSAERWNGQTVTAFSMYLARPAPSVDCAALLDAYLTYCGLDALTDWQPIALPQEERVSSAALYSPGAQLCAQALLDDRYSEFWRFSLQLVWLSRQDAASYGFAP